MVSRQKKLGVMAVFLAGVFACVTINIYFPAEKVESVAGEIVKDIRGQGAEGSEAVPKSEPESSLQERWFALFPFVGAAWAEDVTVVSNPAIRALKESMKSRYPLLRPFYQKGAIREGDDGFLVQTGSGEVSLKEKRDLNTLVSAENADRRRLYQEVAKALNIDPSQVDRIGGIFAKEWQKPVR